MSASAEQEPDGQAKAASLDGLQGTGSPTEGLGKTVAYRETLLLLAKMMGIIFLCEAAIMALLYAVPLSGCWAIIADPLLLTVLGAPVMYWLIIRPIKRALEDRKRAEQKLLVYQWQLKSLASQLSLTEERERHRLAMELHDRVGQSLILCKIKLDQLRLHGPPGELEESVQEICDDLREIIQRTRNLMSDLSSPILYDLGLEAALEEWLTVEIKRKHGIETEFADDGRAKPLDDDVRTVLFRNVRELLTNVVQHAGAKKVNVSVRRVDRDIEIHVEDDGVGFDPAEVNVSAARGVEFGFLGIRERQEQIGGLIKIVSGIDGGTKITIRAPLKQMEPDGAPPTG